MKVKRVRSGVRSQTMPSMELINASIFCCEKLSAASWL